MPDPIKAARLADHIRDLLATWLARDLPGSFVTVTQVTFNPALTVATAWVSFPLPDQRQKHQDKIRQLTRPYTRDLAKTLSRKKGIQLEFIWEKEDPA
jgi:ribosome-binding factor A